MNATLYKKVLEKTFPEVRNIFGSLEWKFQHNNAPIHTRKNLASSEKRDIA